MGVRDDRSQRPTWPGFVTGRYVAIWSVCGPVTTLRPGPCVDRSQRCDLVCAWTVASLRPDPCGPVATLRTDLCGPVATFRPGLCSVRSLCVDRFGYLSDVRGQLVFGGSIEAF
ncbi:hypothetical protein F2Q69_00013016 [Brassica cretica]|uniref:Uncharacterized protein n=1 Tax=Brassica cretica TaxID=69181 RepID=A0A8S9R7K5_BRACR|nr:hypothetical protein F2Q69_00013016 [Brassica cretica]